MLSVRLLPEFTAWIDQLKDAKVRAIVAARVRRLQLGLPGDVKAVGGGVSELRIHVGAGWRLYFTMRGTQLVLLLLGGSKKTQARDIERAKRLAASLSEETE